MALPWSLTEMLPMLSAETLPAVVLFATKSPEA
jgi:hypothetical protein